jgi:hypothetical protein
MLIKLSQMIRQFSSDLLIDKPGVELSMARAFNPINERKIFTCFDKSAAAICFLDTVSAANVVIRASIDAGKIEAL